MKVTKEQLMEHRARILSAAATLFREHGFEEVGVADVMKRAGLTHGGFYGHFASKDDLIAQACEATIAQTFEHWKQLASGLDDDVLPTLKADYLTTAHRDHPGNGCSVAALGSDIAREQPGVRHVFTERLRSFMDTMAQHIPGRSQAAKREKFLATYATLVGAMVLARMVDDPALSEEILQAALATDE